MNGALKMLMSTKKPMLTGGIFRKSEMIRNMRRIKRRCWRLPIALELSMDETKDLLMRAGFAFSCCSKFDVIICYFIENGMYDIFEINEMLFAYGQPVLGE